MKSRVLAACAVAAFLSLGAGSGANALGIDGVYTLDICGGATPCPTSYGTVTILGDQTGSLSYTFNISGAVIHSNGQDGGLSTLVESVSASTGTFTTSFSNTTFTYQVDTTLNADGINGSPGFTTAQLCTNPGTGGNCGTTVTVTFTANTAGAILTAGTTTVGSTVVYAGADLSCVGTGGVAGVGCTLFGTTPTGMVGATATAVPLPLAGAGLPGLVMACGGLLALARRRRRAQSI